MDSKLHSSEFVIDKHCCDKINVAKIYLEKNANIKLCFLQCFDDKQWVSLAGVTKEDVLKVQRYIECCCNPDHVLIVNTLSKQIINLLRCVLSFRWHIEWTYSVVITVSLSNDVEFSGCDLNVVQASSALDILNSRYMASRSLLSDLNPTSFEDFVDRCNRFHLRRSEIKLIDNDLLYTVISWLENQHNLEKFKNADNYLVNIIDDYDDVDVDVDVDNEVAEIIEKEHSNTTVVENEMAEITQSGHSSTPVADNEIAEVIQKEHSSTPDANRKSSENCAVAKLSSSLNESTIVISDGEESLCNMFTGISETALGNIRRQGLELGYSEKEVESVLKQCAVNSRLPPVAQILQHLRTHRLTRTEQPLMATSSQSNDSMDVEITLEEQVESKDEEDVYIVNEEKSKKCRPSRRIAANFPCAGGGKQLDDQQQQLLLGGASSMEAKCSFINAPSSASIVKEQKSASRSSASPMLVFSASEAESDSNITVCQKDSARPLAPHFHFMTPQLTTGVANRNEQLRKDQQSLLDKSFQSTVAAEDDIALSKQMRAVIMDPPPSGVQPENLRYIVVDASNVAVSYGNQQFFDCRGVLVVVQWFLDRGHRNVLAVLPRHRRGTRGGPFPTRYNELLDDLERQKLLTYTPSRVVEGRREAPHDDAFILQIAADNDAVVVSNDQYREFMTNENFSHIIRNRLLSYTIAMGKIYFAQDPFGVGGVSLDQLLSVVPISPSRQKALFTKHNRDTLKYVLSMKNKSSTQDNLHPAHSQNGTRSSAAYVNPVCHKKSKKAKRKQNNSVSLEQLLVTTNEPNYCNSDIAQLHEVQQQQQQINNDLLKHLLLLFPANYTQIRELLLEQPQQQDVNILSNILMDRLN